MPTPNLIGQQIHHYEILSHLGGGGMGVVYKAKDTKLGRTVALKFLAPQLTSDPDLKKRFVQEAKAASALDHPNIGTIFEINETDDGQLFIAMAYYEGETLKDKIAQGPIPTEQAIDYAAQIAKGLAKAHDANIVHRDIKPANILITSDNTVKIVDFGLAKMTGETQLTKTGSTIGTIAYMSPEQLKGEEVDHRTDIWSLGVVLYEMVMGERPYKGEYEHQIIYQVMHDEVKMDDVPGQVKTVITGALQKEPKDRYSNCKYLLDVLAPGAVRSSSHKVFAKPSNASVKWVALIGVIAAVLMGVRFFSSQQEKPAKTTPQLVQRQLTFTGNAFEPAISPDGELMAYYVEETETSRSIYIREVEGGKPIEALSDVERYFSLAKWSPDGSMVAILGSVNGTVGLYLVSRLGELRKVISSVGNLFSWAPDNQRIVFPSPTGFTIVDIATLEERFVAWEEPYYRLEGIEWSPTGNHFALVTADEHSYVLRVVDLEGETLARLDEGAGFTSPRWNKEGTALYYYKLPDMELMSLTYGLWKVHVDPETGMRTQAPSLMRRETKGWVFTVSGDNTRLLNYTNTYYSNLYLYTLPVNGDQELKDPVKLTHGTSLIVDVKFSPHNDEIGFTMQDATGMEIHTVGLDGTGLRKRSFIGEMIGRLAWHPERNEVAFVQFEGGNSVSLNLMDMDTGQLKDYTGPRLVLSDKLEWEPGRDVLHTQVTDYSLTISNPETGEESIIVQGDSSAMIDWPQYSPDGSKNRISERERTIGDKSGACCCVC